MPRKMMNFELPNGQSSIIKVIGVGGGGSNAVNHMYNEGIKGVDFVVCNTDAQALDNSPVPNKIALGSGLTEGLGAGGVPGAGGSGGSVPPRSRARSGREIPNGCRIYS